MTRRLAVSFVSAVALAVSACGQAAPPDTTAADTTAINAVRNEFLAAYNAGDAARAAAGYAPNGMSFGNHQATLNGREAILASMKGQFEAMTAKIELMPDETKILGDWAIDRGRFKIALTPKAAGAPPINDEGRYVVMLQRQADKSWKVVFDMDNSSLPMPEPGKKEK